MVPGHVVNGPTSLFPTGVTFQNIAGNQQGVTQAAFANYPANETVVIIAAWPTTPPGPSPATSTAPSPSWRRSPGKFMAESLGTSCADPAAYALWLFDLTKSCHCGHGVLDTGTLRKRYANGRGAGDLLAGGSGSRAGAEPAIGAFDLSSRTRRCRTWPRRWTSFRRLRRCGCTRTRRGTTCRRPYVVRWPRATTLSVLLEELAKARDVLRYAGRRERKRVISRTLLVKGLEYDHVIIADVGDHAKVNDLYVALSRARKSITILGSSNTLQLQPSPKGG